MRYRIELAKDDNDTIMVTCPVLPEVITFGDDEESARDRATHAIEEAIAARIDGGLDIPPGDAGAEGIHVPVMTAIKVDLYRQLRRSGITRAELARRLGWHREQVDRLFRLQHASRLDQIEAAFRALGTEIAFVVRPSQLAAA
jgi:antitoxin HicB